MDRPLHGQQDTMRTHSYIKDMFSCVCGNCNDCKKTSDSIVICGKYGDCNSCIAQNKVFCKVCKYSDTEKGC